MSPRSPRALRVVVIGAGMAGILAGIRLAEAGFSDYVIFEKSARVGGTWRENTYPGIACDVPAHLYTYSFAPNPDWSQTFAPGSEIQAYFERMATQYQVMPHIRFNAEITRCEFVEGLRGRELSQCPLEPSSPVGRSARGGYRHWVHGHPDYLGAGAARGALHAVSAHAAVGDGD